MSQYFTSIERTLTPKHDATPRQFETNIKYPKNSDCLLEFYPRVFDIPWTQGFFCQRRILFFAVPYVMIVLFGQGGAEIAKHENNTRQQLKHYTRFIKNHNNNNHAIMYQIKCILRTFFVRNQSSVNNYIILAHFKLATPKPLSPWRLLRLL